MRPSRIYPENFSRERQIIMHIPHNLIVTNERQPKPSNEQRNEKGFFSREFYNIFHSRFCARTVASTGTRYNSFELRADPFLVQNLKHLMLNIFILCLAFARGASRCVFDN